MANRRKPIEEHKTTLSISIKRKHKDEFQLACNQNGFIYSEIVEKLIVDWTEKFERKLKPKKQ